MKINKVNEISFSCSLLLIHKVQKESQNWKLNIVGAGIDADCIYRSIIATGSLADPADIIPGSMVATAELCCTDKCLALNNWSKNWWWRSPPHVPNEIQISGTVAFLVLQSKGGYNYILDLWIIEIWLGFFYFNVKSPRNCTIAKASCNSGQQWERECNNPANSLAENRANLVSQGLQ